MDEIKESFSRVKQDINSLKKDVSITKESLSKTKKGFVDICDVISKLNEKVSLLENQNKELVSLVSSIKDLVKEPKKENSSFQNQKIDKNFQYFSLKFIPFSTKNSFSTDNPSFSTDNPSFSTDNIYFKVRNDENQGISTRNRGVQTDRQTDRQTDNQRIFSSYNQNRENSLDSAEKALDSLDAMKKELRLKFKRLTEQEFLVFSTIYQLNEEKGYSNYKAISTKLGLTESSIRDYVRRLINKNIPLEKIKINNKEIQIQIPSSLKKIASLSTIIQLISL